MRQMKDSGIEWIGQIPQEWNVIRVKHLATQKGSLFLDGDWINSDVITTEGIRYLTSGNVGEGFYKEQGNGHIDEETFRKLNCLKAFPEDLMISRLNEPVGRCCIVPDTHPYYVVAVDNVILRPDNGYNKKFILYCMNTQGYAHAALMAASGTTMVRISRTSLGNLSIPIASAEEQERIVVYLDAKCTEIDALIEAKEKTNALLRERRQSIIYEAVTKGLNPDVPMKDSGIEWIGMIPAHWEVRRLKIIADMQTGTTPKTTSTEYFDGDVNWFTPADFSGEMVIKESERKLSCKAIEDGQAHLFPKNTIMFVGIGATVGKIAFVQVEASCNQQITAVLPKDPERTKYYAYWLASCSSAIKSTANYTTLPIINNQHLGETPCPYVFDANEQSRITDYLDSKCSEIDNLISANEATIQKLKEYRQSIIYEAVTGKIEI